MASPLVCLLARVLFLFISVAVAAPSASNTSTQQACNAISQANAPVSYPGDAAYEAENALYWSAALPELKPACIVLPTSAGQVGSAIQVLSQSPDVNFTVKSGGVSLTWSSNRNKSKCSFSTTQTQDIPAYKMEFSSLCEVSTGRRMTVERMWHMSSLEEIGTMLLGRSNRMESQL